ncbi:MAG TPA: hypothetical protein VMS98_01255 [Thermoanaerobaculia bacterium]|nr:hypothetical protein [Thermoanaerobaculia bacterium]
MKRLRVCLLWLAIYALIVIALVAVIERRLPDRVTAVVVGLVAGGLVAAALGHAGRMFRNARELMLIRAGLAGQDPRDGKLYAAVGPITPGGGARLLSPLSRTPAVVYTYEILMDAGRRRWQGLAMVPSTIRCGLTHVRLLAFPELVDFPRDRPTGAAVQRAEDYVRTTEFQPLLDRKKSVRERMSDGYEVYRDGDGTVRQDRGQRQQKPSLGGALLFEQVLRPNDTICAIGTYSTERRGLIADPNAVRHSVRIEKAQPWLLMLRRLAGIGGGLMNAVVMLGIVAAALIALYTIVPLDAVDLPDVSWLEIGVEDLVEDRLRTPLLQAGMPVFVQAAPGASLQPGQARGSIRIGGKEAVVTNALAQWHEGQVAMVFLDGKTAVGGIMMSPDGRLTRLRLFSEDVPWESGRTAKLVAHKTGHQEVAGRLSWIRDGVPMCRVVFRAPISEAETAVH